jgi:hypothetical protein
MEHQVWYALYYNNECEPIVDMVTVPNNTNITHVKQAVYNDNIRTLSGLDIDKTLLKIYAVGTDITTINASTPAIELDTLSSTLVTTARQPVVVVARIPQISPNASATATIKRSRVTTDEANSQSNLGLLTYVANVTNLIVNVHWQWGEQRLPACIPFTVKNVPVTGTVGTLKMLFTQTFQDLIGVDKYWWRGRQVIVKVNDETLQDAVELRDVVKRWQQIVIGLGPTPPITPDKQAQHRAPQLTNLLLPSIPKISRLNRVHECYQKMTSREAKICMLSGPPGSGKTSLVNQLMDHFRFVGNVHAFSLQDKYGARTIQDALDLMKLADHRDTLPTLVVVDEVQCSYQTMGNDAGMTRTYEANDAFWGIIKRMTSGSIANNQLHVVLVAAYGSESDALIRTPGTIDTKLGIDTLLMDDNELKTLMAAYMATKGYKSISEPLQRTISMYLGNHIGLVGRLLDFFLNQPSTMTDQNEMAHSLLAGQAKSALLSYRSLPKSINRLDHQPIQADRNFLHRMLLAGGVCHIIESTDFESIERLVKSYYIAYFNSNTGVKFASPLIADAVRQMLYGPAVSPKSRPSTLKDFVVQAVTNMSHRALTDSYSTGTDQKVFERQLQMEFYRSGYAILGKTITISADVGPYFHARGYVDFYVGDHRWAIELTRNDSAIGEHLDRFQPGGAYYIIPFNEWAVLNFIEARNGEVHADTFPNEWRIYWNKENNHVKLYNQHFSPQELMMVGSELVF